MAKPTPIPTAQRALATAIKALESISISTGIKGTAIKLGNEFVTDTNAVLNDLANVKADAQALVDGLNTMLNKLAETANTKSLEALIKEDRLDPYSPSGIVFAGPVVDGQERCNTVIATDDSLTTSEFVQAELNSTVPIERTAAPELFAATPTF